MCAQAAQLFHVGRTDCIAQGNKNGAAGRANLTKLRRAQGSCYSAVQLPQC